MARNRHTGFMTVDRREPPCREKDQRIGDFQGIEGMLSKDELARQSERCMDCGVPYCHAFGCPLGNRMPDYHDELCGGNWKAALEILHETNNFPEFTGRVCPALCEASCTLSVGYEPVLCRHIEMQIAERGWQEGWIKPQEIPWKSGKRTAVIGSGPAGLAAAQELVRCGHQVTVFEQSDRIGGILRYGIPSYKLEKWVIDRRLEQLQAEGIIFETEVTVGSDISARYLRKHFDAVLIAAGASRPRDLEVPGRELKGIHTAMEFLTQQARLLSGDRVPPEEYIDPKGKQVVIIGGGDTGSDCAGTSIRRGAETVTQIELLGKPPEMRREENPWPEWPNTLRTSTSHEEGCTRLWSVLTKQFYGTEGRVRKIGCAKLNWDKSGFSEIPGSDFLLDADLVFLSMGFIPDENDPLADSFSLETSPQGWIAAGRDYASSEPGVFAAGDIVTGPSLIVRAIHHGRNAAAHIHRYLLS